MVAQCAVLECDKSVAARFIEKSTTSRFTPARFQGLFCPNKCDHRTFSEALGGCLRKDRLGVCGVKICRTDRFPTKGFACRSCIPAVRVETDRRFRPEMLAFMRYQCRRNRILEEFCVPIPDSTRKCVKTHQSFSPFPLSLARVLLTNGTSFLDERVTLVSDSVADAHKHRTSRSSLIVIETRREEKRGGNGNELIRRRAMAPTWPWCVIRPKCGQFALSVYAREDPCFLSKRAVARS